RVLAHADHAFADALQVAPQRLLNIIGVLAFQIIKPGAVDDALAILGLLGKPVDLQRAVLISLRLVEVPAFVTEHVRILRLAVDGLLVGVDVVDLLAPTVEILVVAGEEIGVHEAGQAEVVVVAMGELAGLRDDDREAPAIDAAVPLAAGGGADLAV